ncbi:MAG: methylenetetrahydrofolate reductase [NAD(P)H] [Verrucomicrobiia bacterium]
MLVSEILAECQPTFSFEFFPPKAEADWEGLFETIRDLMPLGPSYVSVTYGAGGTTRDRTHRLVVRLQEETELTVVSHLTCVGSSKAELREIIERYYASGLRNILALRGDAPKGQADWTPAPDGFRYAAELVAFIKGEFPEMCVGVAGFPEGHPGTPNRLKEIEYLKAKVEAGADYIVTQLFFDNRDFYDFQERCEWAGIRVPVIAGIMPITSLAGMHRMAELAAGARIPAKLLRAVGRASGGEGVENVGIHWATEQIHDLLDHGVRGIHFYTLNKSPAALKIYRTLGLGSRLVGG